MIASGHAEVSHVRVRMHVHAREEAFGCHGDAEHECQFKSSPTRISPNSKCTITLLIPGVCVCFN